jgi:transposase
MEFGLPTPSLHVDDLSGHLLNTVDARLEESQCLVPMFKVVRMIKSQLDNILTFLQHGITNAAAEGLKSRIQTIKVDARGFRNFANYRVAILFHCGGLKLYSQQDRKV